MNDLNLQEVSSLTDKANSLHEVQEYIAYQIAIGGAVLEHLPEETKDNLLNVLSEAYSQQPVHNSLHAAGLCMVIKPLLSEMVGLTLGILVSEGILKEKKE